MAENVSKSRTIDLLSLAFEIQKSALQMQGTWSSLLLGSSSSSGFIDDYKNALKNSQSRSVQRNRRSYDELNFEIFNAIPTLYLDFFNEINKLHASEQSAMTRLKKSA